MKKREWTARAQAAIFAPDPGGKEPEKEMKPLALTALLATLPALPLWAQEGPQAPEEATAAGGFCIVNASDKMHLFATETREGARQLAELAPGETLCATGTAAADGIVSVFEDAEGFEGCSRIVPSGRIERMLEYAAFDRCRWGSRDS